MQEVKAVGIVAYRDDCGDPTCATDFQAGEVCQFMTTRKFGLVEVCAATGRDLLRGPPGVSMHDRVADPAGHYLRPDNECPIWSNTCKTSTPEKT